MPNQRMNEMAQHWLSTIQGICGDFNYAENKFHGPRNTFFIFSNDATLTVAHW